MDALKLIGLLRSRFEPILDRADERAKREMAKNRPSLARLAPAMIVMSFGWAFFHWLRLVVGFLLWLRHDRKKSKPSENV